MTRGLLLLATGEPYYGRMAFNLALSVKATDPDFPVAVVYSGPSLNHLNDKQRSIFDKIIRLPANINESFGAKLHLDELSPFDETLFCDADMAWLPKYSPAHLFDQMAEVDFSAITEGYCDMETMDKSNAHPKYYFWADTEEIANKYNVKTGKMYQWRSEVIYFKKSERVLSFFAKAREIYSNPGLKTVTLFAGKVPDELAVNISAAVHGIEPHQYRWMPAYWARMNGDYVPALEELYSKYYLLSCGSNVSAGNTKLAYNRIIKAAAYKMGYQHLFPLVSKKEFMTSRARM